MTVSNGSILTFGQGLHGSFDQFWHTSSTPEEAQLKDYGYAEPPQYSTNPYGWASQQNVPEWSNYSLPGLLEAAQQMLHLPRITLYEWEPLGPSPYCSGL